MAHIATLASSVVIRSIYVSIVYVCMALVLFLSITVKGSKRYKNVLFLYKQFSCNTNYNLPEGSLTFCINC